MGKDEGKPDALQTLRGTRRHSLSRQRFWSAAGSDAFTAAFGRTRAGSKTQPQHVRSPRCASQRRAPKASPLVRVVHTASPSAPKNAQELSSDRTLIVQESARKAVLKARALQTPGDCRTSLNFAKRLECGAFTSLLPLLRTRVVVDVVGRVAKAPASRTHSRRFAKP